MSSYMRTSYRWKVPTSDGRLLDPTDTDSWPFHPSLSSLSREFDSPEAAKAAFIECIENGVKCPGSMILVTECHKEINWDG